MIELLKNSFVPHVNNLKPIDPKLEPQDLAIRYEDTTKDEFDIIDKAQTIIVDLNNGSATFHNPNDKSIRIIDYENILDQFPDKLQKGIKRCDFIVYHSDGNSFFILNELSQSNNVKAKLKDAIEQLYASAMHLTRVGTIKDFIDNNEKLQCIFSNRNNKVISSPELMAEPFNLILELLPEPIIHENHRINKLGFELIETDQIYL